MQESFIRPHVVVSRCLGFDACRYDGRIVPSPFLEKLAPHMMLSLVCPELGIGLGIPRDPLRIVVDGDRRRLEQPATNRDLTERMHRFGEESLDSLGEVDGFILKSRSPSCAIRDAKLTLPGEGVPDRGRGSGLYAEAVLDRFGHLAVEDEHHLERDQDREHFLTRIFAGAALRETTRRGILRPLTRFHDRHQLLLASRGTEEARALAETLANRTGRPAAEVIEKYTATFHRALSIVPTPTAQTTLLLEALGRFQGRLLATEKAGFLQALRGYREGHLSLSRVTTVIRSWLARLGEERLLEQVYFQPFPAALAS